MSDLPRAAGSGVPVKIRGETLLIAPLTLRDIGTIKQHLLKRWTNPIELVMPSVKDLPEPLARELLFRAYDDAKKLEKVSDADVDAFTVSVEGLAFQLWLSLQHSYSGKYTLEDVEQLLDGLTPEEVSGLAAAMQQASGMDDLGNSTGRAGPGTIPDAAQAGDVSSAG